jgi:hypothetical protein
MAEKQRMWREFRAQTIAMIDKLGMPIDRGIVDTVTILRLLGFHTTGSCGGHIRRTTSGPYVIFESPKAHRYATMARELHDVHDSKYITLRNKANRLRALDLNRLSAYLDEFYRDRHLDYRSHLIVQSMPMTLNILKCHGAEIALVVDSATKRDIVKKNQAEIAAFTEYLKARYFEDC